MKSCFARCSTAIVMLLALGAAGAPADEPAAAPKAGATFSLEGRQATVSKLDFLPLVENDYSRRHKFDSYDNPKLKDLRERYKLDEVVAPGKDEFDRQVLLLDWVNGRFKKFGTPSAQPKGAAEILRDIDDGHTFFCAIIPTCWSRPQPAWAGSTAAWPCGARLASAPASIRRPRSGRISLASG